jgi:small subunit ribosomal protein S8e
MGISRSSKLKLRKTGGMMPIHQKKRKYLMGRPSSNTKLGEKKVVTVRCRGGNTKRRALRINEGNFNWISEKVTRKSKIIEVIYNATHNELVRTQRIVKGCIVSIDPTPFKYYWHIHYEEKKINRLPEIKDPKRSQELEEKKAQKQKKHPFSDQLDKYHAFFEGLNRNKLLAKITSRPGQSGRADGYLLEGKELEFYLKKAEKK